MPMTIDHIHEECGVFGISSPDNINVASACYYALYALQHRGQESCGIAVNDRGVITSHKDQGLVDEVFSRDELLKLGSGYMAVAHCRYGAMGISPELNAQPLVVNHLKGSVVIVNNGSLTNANELREDLMNQGSLFHSSGDAEVIAQIIIKERLQTRSIEQAVSGAMNRLRGAYAFVLMSPTKMVGVRDPYGFHPLCIGRIGEKGYVLASETAALDSIGAEFLRDVEPGEIVLILNGELTSIKDHVKTKPKRTCVFEYIYFARPDSVIDGSSVHLARQRAGAFLALEHPVQADVVIGVPDSGIDAAIGYSKQSGIPYGLGFIKNKYIGRTFIQPTQSEREDLVRIKLNPVAATVAGKRVVMIDDSIVRGTTSARIVNLLREAGAIEVHLRSSAPPFLHPCYYGTDIDNREVLIAHNHTIEEIRDIIGVDSLGYLSIQNVSHLADNSAGFCTACFTGEYPETPPKLTVKPKHERKIMSKEAQNA